MEITYTRRFWILILLPSACCASGASVFAEGGHEARSASPPAIRRAPERGVNDSPAHHGACLKTQDYPPAGAEILANSYSRKFHRPGCEFALVMRTSRRNWLRSVDAAIEQQLRPCCWCFPAFTATVEAQLITPLPPEAQLGRSTQPSLPSEKLHTEKKRINQSPSQQGDQDNNAAAQR
ncbi:MAG: hypothetical protein K2W95_03790 [Candidatus Obscuribacterales bacterium]|nr:hypothetical protein [Candidatus Obscuribacterales bacterium]